jgi:pimeloyl-ACP methyl ester carboxylesterase
MRQVVDPDTFDPRRPPLLVIPGYGMNSSIFGYHPSGPSMEECFAAAGYEVWSVDLRGQGESFRLWGRQPHGLKELADVDVRTALRTVRERCFSTAGLVHGIGCSLGATTLYLHLAHPDPEPLASIVSIGGPLRWLDVHPLLKRLFVSPRLAGFVPIRGTRRAVRMLLPMLLKFPRMLSLYLHPDLIDTSDVERLVQSIEDPSRQLNREIAEWIYRGELYVDGKPVHETLAASDVPLLCVAANADGIVPPASVFSAYHSSGSAQREKLLIGDETRRFAHADLFVSRHSQELVFRPIADWLGRVDAERVADPMPTIEIELVADVAETTGDIGLAMASQL